MPCRSGAQRLENAVRHRFARLVAAVLALLIVLVPSPACARVLEVGPQRAFKAPSAAARIARDGDVIRIDAGVYAGDAAVWRANGLRITAAGGPVLLRAQGAHAEGKATWVIKGRDTHVEGIAFEGARVPDGYGAGIRHEGLGLAVRRCRFERNQMGLLTHNDARNEILIEASVFAHNGPGPRHNHNLYVGRIAKLVVRESWLHHARIGHNVKSRAAVTQLLYNRIMDESDGYSSYAVDLPDGGDALLVGNIIQQGPHTENWALVSYAAEGRRHRVDRLRMAHNTLVNDAADGVFVHVHPGSTEIMLVNNLLVGAGRAYLGVTGASTNDVRMIEGNPFVNRTAFDYRPRADARVVDAAVALPHGLPAPEREYRHPLGSVPRPVLGTAPDVGALEMR